MTERARREIVTRARTITRRVPAEGATRGAILARGPARDRHPRDALDDEPGENETPIAIDRSVAGCVGERPRIDLRETIGATAVLAPQGSECLQATAVGEDHANSDARFRGVAQFRKIGA